MWHRLIVQWNRSIVETCWLSLLLLLLLFCHDKRSKVLTRKKWHIKWSPCIKWKSFKYPTAPAAATCHTHPGDIIPTPSHPHTAPSLPMVCSMINHNHNRSETDDEYDMIGATYRDSVICATFGIKIILIAPNDGCPKWQSTRKIALPLSFSLPSPLLTN